MLTQITQNDDGQVVWSPDGSKLAYITKLGLQAYVIDTTANDERHLWISSEPYEQMQWSPTGRYLVAQQPDGGWRIFSVGQRHAHELYHVLGSSLEWLSADTLVYVPDGGGLMLVHVGMPCREIPLAG
jgi:Tol biopolymer transport system component